MMISKSMRNNPQQIQLKLSTIFKEKVNDTPQAFGYFYDANGEKYCAVSVLLKYLGYDIVVESKKTQDDNNTNPTESIPYAILEMIENFTGHANHKINLKCFCKRPYYYYFSLISLLIHLNDYHKMTFTQIGNWLESKGI
jgi:hypothetical protein